MAYIPTTEEYDALIEAFSDFKAENDRMLQANVDATFVSTAFYDEARIDGKCIIVGRKGSGKSAMVIGHQEKGKSLYLISKSLEADEIPFTAIYNFFFKGISLNAAEIARKLAEHSTNTTVSDVATLVEPTRLSAYAWRQAIVKSAVFFTADELLKSSVRMSPEERNALQKIVAEIRDELSEDASVDENAFVFGLLTKAYGHVSDLLEMIIKEFGGLWAGLIAKIVNKIIGAFRDRPSVATLAGIEALNTIMAREGKRTFISYDRFDDFYDEHYVPVTYGTPASSDEESATRKRLLGAMLQGLILAAGEIKRNPDMRWLDLLVTLPMDKFLELRLRERARIEADHIVYLQWTPLELYEFVNRRIAQAIGDKLPSAVPPWVALFPEPIPHVLVHGAKEDSFLYIVRHSLNKPREISMYLKDLFRELQRGYRSEDIAEKFRGVVQRTSKEIIRLELKEEWVREFPGLKSVFSKIEVRKADGRDFDREKAHNTKAAVLDYQQLCELVAGTSLSPQIKTPADVLVRLYHIGVVGLRRIHPMKLESHFIRTVTQNRQEISYCYFYNSDDDDPFTGDASVVFHPLFFDELGISAPSEFIVNELTWEMFQNGRNRQIST